MQSLYSNGFEEIYDKMYQTFINYNEEYLFYSTILKKHKKNSVLEIGSGTGNLAKFFITNQFDYIGLDYSQDMINLASNKNPNGSFKRGDMRDFNIKKPIESIIITGRTSSYLLSNKDVSDALNTIYNNLDTDGILCFDFIDANRFFKKIKNGKNITHNSLCDNKKYQRESYMNTNTSNNFMFNWHSRYFEIAGSHKNLIAEDDSEVRAFTKNEWELFLYLNNFKLLEFIDRRSYAFDTYVVVAQKIIKE